MTRPDLAAQLREEIALTEKSIFFWGAQPDDATVPGWDLHAYRAGLQRQLDDQKAALKILEGL